MKKTLNKLLLASMLMVGANALGQASGQRFSPSSSDPQLITDQQGIKVYYQQGNLGTMPAICLDFKNTGTKEIVFDWTLKDAKGNAVHTGKNVKLQAGQSLDATNNPVLKTLLTFIVNNGMHAADYKTEITIKN